MIPLRELFAREKRKILEKKQDCFFAFAWA
jgi:hypothetical protein